jgi:probable phosphomutase (TIGR03848 family)
VGTVILLRHGRTTANTDNLLAGRGRGVRLDDHGRAQAEAAATRLTGVKVARIVSSPLERCRQTAKALTAVHPDVPVRTDRGLVEVDYGEWTGRRLPDLAKEPLWKAVQANPSAVSFPRGESMAGMAARVVQAVRRLDAEVCDEHGPDTVWVAVSHGDPIKAVLADALGMHLDVFQRIVVDPASISVVRYSPLRPFVLMSNTHAGSLQHLNPPRRGRRRRSTGDAAVGGGAGPGAPRGRRPRAERG